MIVKNQKELNDAVEQNADEIIVDDSNGPIYWTAPKAGTYQMIFRKI